MIESFEDVRGLGETELRALLEDGRPEERVWAIWALALRSAHVGELAARQEPDPGVRRNLAIVLAGHGELELLVALAKRDPAPEVRASAIQLVTRLALDGKLPIALVAERAAADGSEVRIAIVNALTATAPRWLVELGVGMLDDRDSEVRYAAFEALTETGERATALVWLEEAPEAESRLALMRWSAHGRVRACAEALATSSRRLRRLLVESVRVATWHDLAPAIDDEPGLVRTLARANAGAFAEIPLASLVRVTLRAPNDPWLLMIRDRLAAIEAPGDVAPLLHAYRDLCARRIAEIDLQARELRVQAGEFADSDLDALTDHRAAFEAALERATQLLVH